MLRLWADVRTPTKADIPIEQSYAMLVECPKKPYPYELIQPKEQID
jgi:hypothetical protein